MRLPYPLSRVAAAALGVCGVLMMLKAITAQAPAQAHSLWDGIYTADQAKRGEPAYVEHCARCHGADLSSGDSVPPLAGTDFLSTWNTKTVGDLFERVRTSMPADKPGTLTRQQDADILAYVLSVNKFPAGAKELDTQADVLGQIQFDPFKQ